MKRKQILLTILSALAVTGLGSCHMTSESSTENGSAANSADTGNHESTSVTPEPVTYKNLQRNGYMVGEINFLGSPYTFNSTADYVFSYGSDGSLGSDLELNFHPNTLSSITNEEDEDYYSVGNNFNTFGFIYSLTSIINMLGPSFGLDASAVNMPNDFSAQGADLMAYAALPAEMIPEETFSAHLVDGQDLVYTDVSKSGTEDYLRAYVSSDVSGLGDVDLQGTVDSVLETISSLEGIKISELDLVTLLGLVETAFPVEEFAALRPVISALGQVIYVLGDGLDALVKSDEEEMRVDVDLGLNEIGLNKANELLGGLLGEDMAGLLSLNNASVGFTLLDEGDMINQFGGLRLDLELGISLFPGYSVPVGFSIDLNFDTESTELASDYFEKRDASLVEYQAIDAQFESLYPKYYAAINTPDLRADYGTAIDGYVTEYNALDDKVQFMLGSSINPDEFRTEYDDRRADIDKILTDYQTNNPTTIADFYKPYQTSYVAESLYWREAIVEKEGGQAYITALDNAINGALDKTEAFINGLDSQLAQYPTITDSELLEYFADYTEYGCDRVFYSSYSEMYTDEQLTRRDQLKKAFENADALTKLSSAYQSAIAAKIEVASDSTGLEAIITAHDNNNSHVVFNTLEAGLKAAGVANEAHIEEILSAEVESIYSDVLAAYKALDASATRETWLQQTTTYTDKIQKLEEIEYRFLGTRACGDRVEELISIVENTLPEAAE